MNIIISRASKEKTKEVQRLLFELYQTVQERYSPNLEGEWMLGEEGEEYVRTLVESDDVCVCLATCKDKPIGVLIVSKKVVPYRKEKVFGEIEGFYVKEEFQRQGVGKDLFEYAINESRKMEIQVLLVETNFHNTVSQQFYKKHGFNEQEVVLEKRL